jgi:hypothetical protein
VRKRASSKGANIQTDYMSRIGAVRHFFGPTRFVRPWKWTLKTYLIHPTPTLLKAGRKSPMTHEKT